MARRRSGGVVITTYAAATAAEMSTRFATVRALALVMKPYVRRGPVDDGPSFIERMGSVLR